MEQIHNLLQKLAGGISTQEKEVEVKKTFWYRNEINSPLL